MFSASCWSWTCWWKLSWPCWWKLRTCGGVHNKWIVGKCSHLSHLLLAPCTFLLVWWPSTSLIVMSRASSLSEILKESIKYYMSIYLWGIISELSVNAAIYLTHYFLQHFFGTRAPSLSFDPMIPAFPLCLTFWKNRMNIIQRHRARPQR